MSFKSGKETDKLWRSLLFEVRQIWFMRTIGIDLLCIIILYFYIDFDFSGIPTYIIIPAVFIFGGIISYAIYYHIFLKSLCKVLQRQQEKLDILLQKEGITEASAFTNVENKEELVEALCKLVFVSDVATRCCITESLGELGGSTASKTLKQLLLDTDDKVRSKAKLSLERLSLKI